jgi:hypothetical protein
MRSGSPASTQQCETGVSLAPSFPALGWGPDLRMPSTTTTLDASAIRLTDRFSFLRGPDSTLWYRLDG